MSVWYRTSAVLESTPRMSGNTYPIAVATEYTEGGSVDVSRLGAPGVVGAPACWSIIALKMTASSSSNERHVAEHDEREHPPHPHGREFEHLGADRADHAPVPSP